MSTAATNPRHEKTALHEPYIGVSQQWHSTKYALRDALLAPAIALGIIMAAFLPVRMAAPANDINEISVVSATNAERIANGLSPLKTDYALTQAAEAKAENMIAEGYFAHYHNGHTPWEFIDAASGTNWKEAGENLAKNYDQTATLMRAWMNSPKHKENILNTHYERIGVAVVHATLTDGTPVSVTVQLFTGG